MPRNKYQRRRALRPATAAPSLIQNELFQHPVQQPKPTAASSDLGREAARQMRERTNRNTRYIDKPEPTTNKNLLRQAQGRQQAASRSVQRQVFGQQSTSSLKPSGRFTAPSIPSPLRFSGAAVRLNPSVLRGNLLAAGIGIALESAAQPVIGWLAENLARGIYGAGELIVGDTDGITFDQWQQIHDQVRQSVQAKRNRGISPTREEIENEIEVLRQRLVNSGISHSQAKPTSDSGKQVKTPRQPKVTTDKSLVPDLNTTVVSSPPPSEQIPIRSADQTLLWDDRNAEYHQRRVALGDNPTKEEMDAVRDYGLEQHRRYFPYLYQ